MTFDPTATNIATSWSQRVPGVWPNGPSTETGGRGFRMLGFTSRLVAFSSTPTTEEVLVTFPSVVWANLQPTEAAKALVK